MGTIKKITEKPPSDEEILKLLRPYVAEWFRRTFGKFTLPQLYAIPRVKQGRNILIFSPTGTGKTLAAFLAILDDLFRLAEKGKLEDHVYCLYVSPLRALINDIRKNLLVPLEGIKKVAEELGYEIKQEIRVAVRHGDTPQSERQRMLKKPPHVLCTTPETLGIILVAPKFRERLKGIRWVIVDEVHELASNKRGAHLSLSLERLVHLTGEFVRIGLSATQAPVEEIAKWLVGFEDPDKHLPRDCEIIEVPAIKRFDLKVIVPVRDLREKTKASERMYKIMKDLILKHKTVLVFTNTRSGSERVAFKLSKELGEDFQDLIGTHHSSLGREVRLLVEDKLKKGQMKVVVTSTSLELGIDIGWIDLVIQVGSPKQINKGLQRIGRSGHALDKVSKGIFIPLEEDDLEECLVIAKCIYMRKLDKIRIPKNCLDILAQHLIGMSMNQKWNVYEAYSLVRRSYTFIDLPFEKFLDVLKYLGGHFAELEYRKVYRKIWFDEKEMMFGRKRGIRAIYSPNVGIIPDELSYYVLEHRSPPRVIGKLSEPFVERLVPGDVFVLAGRKFKVLKIRGDIVHVQETKEENPTVPSWIGEMLPRTWDLSIEIGKFRETLEKIIKEKGVEEAIKWVMSNYPTDRWGAENIVRWISDQMKYGIVATHKRVVIEPYVDDFGAYYLIFLYPFGRKVNDALSRAYAYVASKMYGTYVRIGIDDNGFVLIFPGDVRPDPMKIVKALKAGELIDVLRKALKGTELFANKFRHAGTLSFMFLRWYRGRKVSVKRRQLRAKTLVNLLPDDFPVIWETYREILEDYMDVKHALKVLRGIEKGEIEVVVHQKEDLSLLSPFSMSVISGAHADMLVTMEAKEAWIRRLYQRLMEKVKTNA